MQNDKKPELKETDTHAVRMIRGKPTHVDKQVLRWRKRRRRAALALKMSEDIGFEAPKIKNIFE